MKVEEEKFFSIFMTVHPNFLGATKWIPGPEPPDVILTDAQDRKLGIELREWLDDRETTPSIADQENEIRWLTALDTENCLPPRQFQCVHIWFRSGTRYSRRDEASFRKEFYQLMSYVDEAWEREMAGTPQKIWNDFTNYPTLGRCIILLRFQDRMQVRPRQWALGTPKGGAYDPRQMTRALLQGIEEKKNKSNYANLKNQYGFAELVLLLHYGIRGLLHNSPFEGLNWKVDNVVSEARANLEKDPGPFDRVFLYLAYNEGRLFNLYP
jgi:hypothetical protein